MAFGCDRPAIKSPKKPCVQWHGRLTKHGGRYYHDRSPIRHRHSNRIVRGLSGLLRAWTPDRSYRKHDLRHERLDVVQCACTVAGSDKVDNPCDQILHQGMFDVIIGPSLVEGRKLGRHGNCGISIRYENSGDSKIRLYSRNAFSLVV